MNSAYLKERFRERLIKIYISIEIFDNTNILFPTIFNITMLKPKIPILCLKS